MDLGLYDMKMLITMLPCPQWLLIMFNYTGLDNGQIELKDGNTGEETYSNLLC